MIPSLDWASTAFDLYSFIDRNRKFMEIPVKRVPPRRAKEIEYLKARKKFQTPTPV